ncbi:hypothetical protein SLS58_002974 [Diplodia intermedia]|uniref:Heterokaryon incompatibility domain-containing protein n=1 Tax=Diplodia intermedia TaxID=856260 RepID=A0ABR3TXG6_9PEZI
MPPSRKRPLPAEIHDDLNVRRVRINPDGLRKHYSYTRLRHTDETRLLTIQPGEGETDVHCTLHHVRFSERPVYEALSYTWGGKEKPCRIECGEGSELAVTRNCFNAIKRLRRAARSRTVWIDAVCIDQEDDAERGHQVGIMPSIYREATRVVVYLGEAADESDRAMDYIHLDKWQDDWRKTVPPVAVQKLLERPWFSRIWVLQEVYMAKSVTVMCGEKSLPWEPYFRQLKDWPSQNALVQVPQILNMRTDQWNKSTISRNLLDLLARTRHCNCEDPRDRIFALLSMSSEDSRLGINVDYTISVEELYANLAMHMIERLGLDEALSVVEFEETRRTKSPKIAYP